MGVKEYIIKIDEDKKDIMGDCLLVEKPKELVRCKDCKYYENSGWYAQCFRHNGLSPEENWFCADGEREVMKWQTLRRF